MFNVIPPTWQAECMHSYVIPASRGAQMYASRGSFIVGVFREAGEQQICTWEGHVKMCLCLCDLLMDSFGEQMASLIFPVCVLVAFLT